MCLNDKNCTKAEKLFKKKIDKKHIQREEVEKLIEKIKIGEVISLSAPENIARLKQDLDMDKLVYSNDMVLDKVSKNTQDIDVRKFIDSVIYRTLYLVVHTQNVAIIHIILNLDYIFCKQSNMCLILQRVYL